MTLPTTRAGGLDNIRKVVTEKEPKTPSTRLTKLGQNAVKLAERRCTDVATQARCLRRELEQIPLKAMRKVALAAIVPPPSSPMISRSTSLFPSP